MELVDKPRLWLKPYDVTDFAEARGGFTTGVEFDPLVHYILRNIAPEYWKANGHPGRILPDPQHFGRLYIAAPAEVHEQIRDGLQALRDARRMVANYEAAKLSASIRPATAAGG